MKFNKIFPLVTAVSIISLSWADQYPRSEHLHKVSIEDKKTILCSDTTELDSLILVRMNYNHIPGLSAAIIIENQIAWTGAYGYADIDNNIPVRDSTLFMLASISKTITGTALMQLWEKNLFGLDDDINNFLSFKVSNPYHPNEPITFIMLLTHLSSINDNWNILIPLYVPSDSPIALDSFLVNYLAPGGIWYTSSSYNSWTPGFTWEYCNVAVALAGYLVEAITDTSFNQYCQEHIFAPLEMNETSWFLSGLDTTHIARPYHWNGSAYVHYPHYGYPDYPDGQLRTSTLQLANFLNAYMNEGIWGNQKILDGTTVELITTVHFSNTNVLQGLIWKQITVGGRLVWGHGGSDSGVSTRMYYSKEDKVGVIVLTNGENYQALYGIVNLLFDYVSTLTPIINDQKKNNIAKTTTLYQNYPNPFNPITTIEFNLPKNSKVSLKVFNILGEEVTTLLSASLLSGSHSVEWDASKYASGVHLYRLQAGDYVETRKMVLMK